MKNQNLTQKYLKECVDYNKKTGAFITWKNRPLHHFKSSQHHKTWNTIHCGKECTTLHSNGYFILSLDRYTYFLHRLAFLYVTGKFPIKNVDHIDGIKNSNKWINLREVTQSENAQNIKKAHKDNNQGLIGAYVDKRDGCFFSSIMINGKRINLGRFPSAQAAHDGYIKAKRELHSHNTL